MTGRIRRLLPLLLLPLLFGACSSTTLNSSWKNPAYQGKVHRVYLMGVATSELTRRLFEDDFAQQLQAEGVTGIPSYQDLPATAAVSREEVTRFMEQHDADSVLMARLIGKRTEEVITPGRMNGYPAGPYVYPRYYSTWEGYYERRYDAIYQPATVSQFAVATIEANLYDLQSGELIWSAQLETTLDSDTQKLIADFARTVIKNMAKHGLF